MKESAAARRAAAAHGFGRRRRPAAGDAHAGAGRQSQRNIVYYYNESELSAIRIGPWKSHLKVRDGFFDYRKPSSKIFNVRMDPVERHGGQKADEMAMQLGVAWGGQVYDAIGAHLATLKQYPPRQAGGSLTAAPR